MSERALLTLCIPTYNRSFCLDSLLKRIENQTGELVTEQFLELIVSDNCSNDNTTQIVHQYIDRGMPIHYIKNESNLGMDGNFVQCFKRATGKYIWLLGDDDFLKEGALNKILLVLNNAEYGLVHLQVGSKIELFKSEYIDSQRFISDISFWITFISSNIVNAKYVSQIDFEKYMGTYFTLIPLYMTAAFSENTNLMIHQSLLEDAADPERNGGYNFFQVFVHNYLSIWREFVTKGDLSIYYFEKEKYILFRYFLLGFIAKLLFRKNIGNFEIKGGWGKLLKKYWYCPYFYCFVSVLYVRCLFRRMTH